jgi:hypothetical protein
MTSSEEARTISRQCVVNKLRSLGYTFKERKKCVEIWRKPGITHRVLLDTRRELSPLYVKKTLFYCKVPAHEIEAFIAQALV